MLAVGLCCAKENCEFLNIDDGKYSASFIKVYNFRCTGIKGYDYVEHEVLIKYSEYLDAVFSSYYIDGTERKREYFGYIENEKKDGSVEFIGSKNVSLYDEFHIQIKDNDNYTSFESMEKTILNKWNRLKRCINKTDLTNTDNYKPDGGWYCDNNDCK